MIFALIILLLLGSYWIYSGIINKPPFEYAQQEKDWENSRFRYRYFTIFMGIQFAGYAIILIIKNYF